MAVPGSIADLSTTASSNPPSGTDAVFPELDNHLRFIYACEALLRDRGGGYLTSVSGVDSITATLTGLSSYQTGAVFAFSPAGANTGAVTLNIGGLGAKSVTYRSTALPAGFLTSGAPVILAYDGTNFDVMADPSPVDRQTAQTIAGIKTFSVAPKSSAAAAAADELMRKQEVDAAISGALGSVSTSSALSFSALALSASGVSASVSISASELLVRNSSNGSPRLLSGVSLTLNSAGSGANGLDTGTLAVSTWYSVWVIWNGTTAASLLSLSATSPTLPGGYTHKTRVGWIRTDATANKYPLAFVQKGCAVQYVLAGALTTYPQMFYGTTSGSQALPVGAVCPSTAGAIAITWGVAGTGSGASMAVGPSAAAAVPPTGFAFLGSSSTSFSGTSNISMLLESTNIYANSNNGNGYVGCTGWTDNL